MPEIAGLSRKLPNLFKPFRGFGVSPFQYTAEEIIEEARRE